MENNCRTEPENRTNRRQTAKQDHKNQKHDENRNDNQVHRDTRSENGMTDNLRKAEPYKIA